MSDTLKKVIAWRVISFTIAITASWVWMGDWHRSLVFTIILMTTLTGVHYVFEKWWGDHESQKSHR